MPPQGASLEVRGSGPLRPLLPLPPSLAYLEVLGQLLGVGGGDHTAVGALDGRRGGGRGRGRRGGGRGGRGRRGGGRRRGGGGRGLGGGRLGLGGCGGWRTAAAGVRQRQPAQRELRARARSGPVRNGSAPLCSAPGAGAAAAEPPAFFWASATSASDSAMNAMAAPTVARSPSCGAGPGRRGARGAVDAARVRAGASRPATSPDQGFGACCASNSSKASMKERIHEGPTAPAPRWRRGCRR
jgi:hypothetical protein